MKHPLNRCVLGVMLLLLVASAYAQEPEVLAGIERAKAALEAKDGESASFELRAIDAALEAVPSKPRRMTLRNQWTALMRRADSRYAARSKALDNAAKALIKSAKTYTAKRWQRTALEMLELAVKLAPQQASEALQDARLDTAPAEPGPSSGVSAFFAKATQPYTYEGKWKLEGEEIHSPPHLQPASTFLRSAKPMTEPDYFIEVEALTVEEAGQYAICLGDHLDRRCVLFKHNYYAREEPDFMARSAPRISIYDKENESYFANRETFLSPRERRDWLKLRVEVRGKKIRGILGGFCEIEIVVENQPLTGHFGLFIPSASQSKGITRFRNLRYGALAPLPKAG